MTVPLPDGDLTVWKLGKVDTQVMFSIIELVLNGKLTKLFFFRAARILDKVDVLIPEIVLVLKLKLILVLVLEQALALSRK